MEWMQVQIFEASTRTYTIAACTLVRRRYLVERLHDTYVAHTMHAYQSNASYQSKSQTRDIDTAPNAQRLHIGLYKQWASNRSGLESVRRVPLKNYVKLSIMLP